MEIQDIKAQLPIQTVLDHYHLTPDRNNRLCCPWHDDKTPSLQIYPKTNTWTCFSSKCNAGSGDVIEMIQRQESVGGRPCTKHDAIMKAKTLLGVNIIHTTSKKMKTDYNELFDKFRANYKKSSKAQAYAKSRMIQNAEIGYNGSTWPHLKNCIVFPLRDKKGNITSFYGRSVANSVNSKHFYQSNRSGLYPTYPPADTKILILSESIIDTIHIEGAKLAMYGTNGLTKEHTECLSGLTDLEEIILFFDGDEAGDEAIKKVTKMLREIRPDIKTSYVETPRGTDINSLVVNHPNNYIELLSDLVANRLSFSIEKTTESGNQTKERVRIPSSTLDTSNPELLTYSTEQLHILILGGIKLTGLDKLRITLKLQHRELADRLPIRSSLDLYHTRQVEQLTEKISDELDINHRASSKIISDLTGALEAYRQDKLELIKPKRPQSKTLNPAEKSAAIKYLKNIDLMANTRKHLADTGLVGEADNAMIALMAYTSRKRKRPLHIMFLGASGTGKTHIQEKVSAVIPAEDRIEITSLSDNAFYYFGKEELKNKLILIEDLDGAENVMYPLRELQSKRKISKKVTLKDNKGNLKTISVEVEGPVSVSGCTTKERLYEDNANRCILLYIDGSKSQDKRIMTYQQKVSAGVINKHQENQIIEQLQNVQRLLKPIKVINPYAELIDLPDEVFKPRRSLLLLLSFIETITYYHQWQRSVRTDRQSGEKYIESTKSDVEVAFELMKEVLFTKSDELSKASRNFLERIKTMVKPGEVFFAKEMRSTLRMNASNIKRYLVELQRYGYIKTKGGNRYRGFEYQITDYNEFTKMKGRIDRKLADILNEIDSKSIKKSSPVVQSSPLTEMVH